MEKKPSPGKKTAVKKAESASPIPKKVKANVKENVPAKKAATQAGKAAGQLSTSTVGIALVNGPGETAQIKEQKKSAKPVAGGKKRAVEAEVVSMPQKGGKSTSKVSRAAKKTASASPALLDVETELKVPLTATNRGANDPDFNLQPVPQPVSAIEQVAGSLDREEVRIFQIHYQPQHAEYLDPDFEPYDNAGISSPLLEFDVFTKLATSKKVANSKLWGAVSWKFGQKTGTTGAEFRRQIMANPGYDVYFSNAYPHIEALFHNLWMQGETAHPDFLFLCNEIFQVAGLPAELLTEIQPTAEFATANYFVATPAFWKRYIAFIKRVLVAADKKISPKARSILYSSQADQKGLHANATYIPFVVERLFSVFLKTEGLDFKAFKVPLQNREDGINVHLKLLSEMKDVAHRTKSLWLAACWVNYRNLYFSNANGNEWTQKYLRKITPSKIFFNPIASNVTVGSVEK